MDSYLIGTYELKELGLIHGNVEDSILKVIIQRAQLSVVKPLLTEKLYERLLVGVEDTDLTPDEEHLLNKYIAPLLAVVCDKRAVKAISYEIRNKGAGTTNDEYFKALDRSESLAMSDEVDKDVQIAKAETVKYLRKNRDKFPLYDPCECAGSCGCGWNASGSSRVINRPNISFL